MKFTPKPSLTEKEIQAGLSAVMSDGLATQAMVVLTSGVFLIAFSLNLGASNTFIGLVAAVLSLTQLLQIPSVYLIQKYRSRRAIMVYTVFFHRICYLFIAFIPFFFPMDKRLYLFILVLALNSGFGAIALCGWNSWMRDLVPQDQLGSFFSRRMSLAMALGIFLSLAAGVFLNYWKKFFPRYEIYSYSLLFLLGFVAGMVSLYFLSITPEPEMAQVEENPGFFRSIMDPFRDANFKNLLVFAGLWHFAINLALPFFSVYMLKGLQLDMSWVIALTLLGQVTNLASLRIWGRLSDLFGNKSIFSINSILFIICTLSWTFTTMPGKHLLTIPLLIIIHIFVGISFAGFTLTADNLGFKLAPREQATSYLAAKNIVQSLAAGIAPILGGKFVDFFTRYEFSWTLRLTDPKGEHFIQVLCLEHWDFFFFFACLIGLYSLYRLTKVKEAGEVKGKVVIDELKAEMKRAIINLCLIPPLAVRAALRRLGYQGIQDEPLISLTCRIEELSLDDSMDNRDFPSQNKLLSIQPVLVTLSDSIDSDCPDELMEQRLRQESDSE